MQSRRNDTRTRAANQKQILARKERAARATVFPELRNTGIMARALVMYVAMIATYVVATTDSARELPLNFAVALAMSLPVTTVVALVWMTANRTLRKLAYWQAAAILCLVAGVAAAVIAQLGGAPYC
jgi:uncharacterized membrane protein YcfT